MVPRAEEPDGMEGPRPFRGGSTRPQANPLAGDKAFAFLSKSFVDAQRGAELDMKLLSARTSRLRKIVSSPPTLEDWENIRIPLSGGKTGKDVTAGELLQQLKASGKRALESSTKPIVLDDWEKIRIPLSGGKVVTAGELVKELQVRSRKALTSPPMPPMAALEEPLDVVKSLQQRIPPALTELQKRLPESLPSLDRKGGLMGPFLGDGPLPFPFLPDSTDALPIWAQPGLQPRERHQEVGGGEGIMKRQQEGGGGGGIKTRSGRAQAQGRQGKGEAWSPLPILQPFHGKQLLSLADWNRAVKEHKWNLPVPNNNWEPLKRVADSLKELQEQSGDASGSPSKGLSPQEALLDLFKLKEVPALRQRNRQDRRNSTSDVPPLAVPEVLEVLVRTSEEVLGSLGVKPEVTTLVSQALRSCQTTSQRLVGQQQGRTTSGEEASLERRLAAVMESTGYQHKDDGVNSVPEMLHRCQEAISGTPRASRRLGAEGKRSVAIVTTACLPWMTGTAVNPLLRAAYLAMLGEQQVTLVVPWLSKEDQIAVYPGSMTFESPAEQEAYVRGWLQQRVGIMPDFKISFYPGKFCLEKRSIIAVGDISSYVPSEEADIAVLEEPEHLTWYYHGRRWTDKFRHVVGIIHTNYLEYVKREKNGRVRAALLEHLNNWMVRNYCHKVVRLSAATQEFPRSTVCNVHGVSAKFLEIGDSMAKEMHEGRTPFSKGAYYLGKMVWSKGYRELVDLMSLNQEVLGSELKVDVFGSGEDFAAVHAEAQAHGLRMQFHKGRDHADASLHGFKVFINPSRSDVVCTTTAEALAMGKIVVCADHPSNDFFRGFPNCYMFRDSQEFVEKVQQAMASEPTPLSLEQRHQLTWEAATHRFLRTAGLESPSTPLRVATPQGGLGTRQGGFEEGEMLEMEGGEGGSGLRRAQSWDDLQELRGSRSRRRSASGLLPSGSTASLSLSLSTPDLSGMLDGFLYASHFVTSGFDPFRAAVGAPPGTKHIGAQQSKELGLPPPWVQRPSYGW